MPPSPPERITALEVRLSSFMDQAERDRKELRDQITELNGKLDAMSGEIHKLAESMSKQRGAFAVLIWVAGIIGALAVKVAGFFFHGV